MLAIGLLLEVVFLDRRSGSCENAYFQASAKTIVVSCRHQWLCIGPNSCQFGVWLSVYAWLNAL